MLIFLVAGCSYFLQSNQNGNDKIYGNDSKALCLVAMLHLL